MVIYELQFVRPIYGLDAWQEVRNGKRIYIYIYIYILSALAVHRPFYISIYIYIYIYTVKVYLLYYIIKYIENIII